MCKYESGLNNWKDVLKVPEWDDLQTAWCSYKCYKIIVGARDRTNGCRSAGLNLKTAKVTNLPDLPSALSGPAVHGTDGSLFVIGGRIDGGNIGIIKKPDASILLTLSHGTF